MSIESTEVAVETINNEVSEDGTTVVGSMLEPTPEDLALPSEEGSEEEVPKAEDKPEETLPSDEPEKLSLIDEYTKLVQENDGVITDEMYKALADKGYDKTTVDTIKAGIEATQASEATAILESAGTTQEDFSQAVEWAKENWSPERIERFNTLVSNNSGDSLVGVIEGLMDNYSSGTSPTVDEPIHSGISKASPSSKGYADENAMLMDMADARYKDTNSPYHRAVKAKAMKSTF